MTKTVLVVDDSRVALMSLARLLKAYGLMVDMVESGPEALDYLRLNPPPAVIFLDHMMPGMDGFETLSAIKTNPATAGIPVVMYTSKEEEAYLNKARALGAADVLQKPAHAGSINRILVAFQIAQENEAEARPVAVAAGRAPPPVQSAPSRAAPPRATPLATPQSPTLSPPLDSPPAGSRATIRVLVRSVALLLLAAAAWWSYLQYRGIDAVRRQLVAENVRLEAAETHRLAAEKAAAQTQALAQARRAVEPADAGALLNTIAWALNQNGRYDFGALPFDDARLQQLRGLIGRLNDAGFRGTVRLDAHLGEFCVVRDDQGVNRLPPPDTAFSSCEVLTYPPAEAVQLAQRQSDAFARFLEDQAAARGPVQVTIVSHGTSRPLQRYPDHAATAAEWNAAARANQRIEFALVPATR